ncbi:hypothetical protein F5877DRAFT_68949 [Lentinula edodes]|nr:hypothetical protein F5877DRAFT_68949 [Lentinula edodes]
MSTISQDTPSLMCPATSPPKFYSIEFNTPLNTQDPGSSCQTPPAQAASSTLRFWPQAGLNSSELLCPNSGVRAPPTSIGPPSQPIDTQSTGRHLWSKDIVRDGGLGKEVEGLVLEQQNTMSKL